MWLTNTFHVAVLLFSNRSQMTSKEPKRSWQVMPRMSPKCTKKKKEREREKSIVIIRQKQIQSEVESSTKS